MAKVLLRNLPTTALAFDVTIAIAEVVHSEDFRSFAQLPDDGDDEFDGALPEGGINRKLLNFLVELNQSTVGTTRNNGSGTLSLPSDHVRRKLLEWMADPDNCRARVLCRDAPSGLGREIKFKRYHGPDATSKRDCERLSKTPYVDPNVARLHQAKLDLLDKKLRVNVVQFGTYYREYPARPTGRAPSRRFSVEWEGKYYIDGADAPRRSGSPGPPSGVAWLRFEYDHKRIVIKASGSKRRVYGAHRLQLGDENTDHVGALIIITFQSIAKLAIGYDPQPYICFDTLTPPILDEIEFHRTLSGDARLDEQPKKRIVRLEPEHERISPYAQQVRIILYNDPQRTSISDFQQLCIDAGISKSIIIRMQTRMATSRNQYKMIETPIESSRMGFFAAKRLKKLETLFREMEWSVVFQMEALLRNGLLNTDELDSFIPQIQSLAKNKGAAFTGHFLQEFRAAVAMKSMEESPAECFERVLTPFVVHQLSLRDNAFNCCHITVTPTRMILDGPCPVQSNRVIRQYENHKDNFVRVDFRDEDKLPYYWARDVDGKTFVKERVGGILKKGLKIGGRTFEFLAYSTSALREHAVWFMFPFNLKDATGTVVNVNSDSIRRSLGNFAGTPLLRCPSKYAARLAQAFTATDRSVEIELDKWEEVPDIIVAGHEDDEKPAANYVHTDGAGTISRELAEEIWHVQCRDQNREWVETQVPSAFQIRFLGYKGVVSVDYQLDKHPKGIRMRLRPSMKKFDSDESQKKKAGIEIARAFWYPSTAYLNRPLVMALEDRGVRQDDLIELQDDAVRHARTIDDGIAQFRAILLDHGLGKPFHLSLILDKLEKLGLDFKSNKHLPGIDDPWIRELRQVAMYNVLRDIKYRARIPIAESFHLVGVADEGPAYRREGFENVYVLPPGKIYACIQRRDDPEPTWLEGSCTISRSPIVHLGDIQRVQAIGKPPEGMLCSFAALKNVVVLPCTTATGDKAPRSLASCLGGGDLDVRLGFTLVYFYLTGCSRGTNSSVSSLFTNRLFSRDMYSVIPYAPLLPTSQNSPASYPDGKTLTLDRDSTIDDIADFVVDYINSDVLGLLSDRLLIIADQSKDGMNDKNCQYLADLCSKAVDYPKQGIAVDLDEKPLPRLLLRCKPDWHASEAISPHETDYYTSDKALGRMFRAIPGTFNGISKTSNEAPNGQLRNPASNPIYSTLLDHILRRLGWSPPVGDAPSPLAIPSMFHKYADQLRYIATTYTLTKYVQIDEPGSGNTASAAANKSLLESELVLGTILAKSSQKRLRADYIYRCRYHTQALVDDVQRRLWKKRDENGNDRPLKLEDLKRAWHAYGYGLSHEMAFGAKSFALLALGTVLDWLEAAKTRPYE
ncbi:RNA-dependent RNA polymerase [Mycena kentingensis (nom. inval.)]|nr:RNA-dependent RNA polymerase [Mycena kentingensis (nom. inval.)]